MRRDSLASVSYDLSIGRRGPVHTKMTEIFYQTLVFVGVLFVAFYGMIEANKRRDSIITGHIGNIPLDVSHRKLILVNDWIPLKFGLGVICGVGGLAIFDMSHAQSLHDSHRATIAMAIVCETTALFFVVYGTLDLIYCVRVLSKISSKKL